MMFEQDIKDVEMADDIPVVIIPQASDPTADPTSKEFSGDVEKDISQQPPSSVGDFFAKVMHPVAGYQRLVTEEKILYRSLYAIRFGIFADACNSTILQPNYPVMVTPGADPDSFPDTAPFEFSTATYAIPMFALSGIALAGLYSGPLSDRIGRKPVLLLSMYGSMVGSILKFLFRGTFWGFCMANLANGLVSGSLPVALAYAGDIFPTPAAKAEEFGKIVGCFVVGQSAGGVFAILMASTGLFTSLWLGAGFMAVAGTLMLFLCIEPKYFALPKSDTTVCDDEDEQDNEPITEIDHGTMWHIIVGALLDNIGSCGLFPLCLSPLAFQRFYQDFVEAGEDPILSLNGYKWMSIMVALVVIPTTAVTPMVYARIGAAGACVMGNLMTAVVTVSLLLLGSVAKASTASLAGFVVVMYLGFPMTVFSQLSTSPMLDACSPPSKRGYVQGLNSTVMNFGTAFAPWVLGIVADKVGTSAAICIGIGVSLLAAAVNAPLMWKKGMGRPDPPKEPMYARALRGEDPEMVERALRGSWIGQDVLTAINQERETKGKPYLYIHPRPFEEDKEKLAEIRAEAKKDFDFQLHLIDGYLGGIAQKEVETNLDQACVMANKALAAGNKEEQQQINQEMGQWFAAYLSASGYRMHTNPAMIKRMIMTAFPVIMEEEEELTPDNLEDVLLNLRRVYAQHSAMEDQSKRGYTYASILGTGTTRNLFYV